jgi:hypothetical protein
MTMDVHGTCTQRMHTHILQTCSIACIALLLLFPCSTEPAVDGHRRPALQPALVPEPVRRSSAPYVHVELNLHAGRRAAPVVHGKLSLYWRAC